MIKINPHEIIPAAYEGREQAYIKHLLLDGYLERLLYIVGWSAERLGHEEIVFVDCFAGPWMDDSEDLASTSIGISLKLLSDIQKALSEHGKNVRFRAIFVEKNARAYARLHRFLAEHTPPNVAASSLHGDFTRSISDILSSCREKSFTFFFIDPKGWSDVKPTILQPLLARPRSEFLINFMFGFANWAASMGAQREGISELLDGNLDLDNLSADPVVRESALLNAYRSALIDRASTGSGRALSAYVTVLDPTVDRTKYHLIYMTRHPKGILEFMTQSERIAGVQSVVRTAAKFKKRNLSDTSGDLFGIDAGQVEPSRNGAKERVEKISAIWLDRLSVKPLAISEAVFASIICESNSYPSELQLALKGLMEQGMVQNIDSDVSKRTKNVVNIEKKERLVRKIE